jgi:hypothetical protein
VSLLLLLLICQFAGPIAAQEEADSLEVGRVVEEREEQLPIGEEPVDADIADGVAVAIPRTMIDVRSRFTGRSPEPRGYRDGTYPGSSIASMQRIRISVGGKGGGSLLLKKDPGERSLDDLFAWNLFLKDVGPMTSIIVGDFVVEGGLGLISWSPYGLKKGSDILAPVLREGKGLTPALSADQIRPFRGLAAGIRLGAFHTDVWWSRRSLAATVPDEDDRSVSGFHTSGLFRTPGELAKRNALVATVAGIRPVWMPGPGIRIGASWLGSSYSVPIATGMLSNHPRRRISHAGLDADVTFGGIRLSGEGAAMLDGGTAYMIAAGFSPWQQATWLISVRKTGRGYFAMHGSPFGETPGTTPEHGIYVAMSMRPYRHIRISWYADSFVFPEGRNGSVFPTRGTEALLHMEYTGIRGVRSQFRYMRSTCGINSVRDSDDDMTARRQFIEQKSGYRCQIDFRISPMIDMRGRFDYHSMTRQPGGSIEHGLMLLQQLRVRMASLLDLCVRMVTFRSDSFESGISLVDLDLPGASSLPVLYGEGMRMGIVAHWSIFAGTTLSVRYSDLVRDDVRGIGTGPDELPANRDSRFGIQLDLRY